MFEHFFQSQSAAVLAWPLGALFLFIAVFFFQVARIVRTPREVVLEQSRLPLADDSLAPRQQGGSHHE